MKAEDRFKRQKRGRLVLRGRSAVYHVTSRVVRRQFWLDDKARERFLAMLRKQAAFTGVEVMSYCLMGNHFHLLLRVPECPYSKDGKHLITDEELLRRYRAFYGDQRVPLSTYSLAELEGALGSDDPGEAEEARRRVLSRMGDLSVFVKELKQRFGIWFNDKHESTGTIWGARFKSVLLEDTAEVLSMVAAYIDLNPVRAKLVDDPKDYRWSGFGEAMAGSKSAREGLVGLYPDSASSYEELIRTYRLLLYSRGERSKRGASEGHDDGLIDPMIVERVIGDGGKVSMVEALHCRWKYFSDSKVLGRQAFSDKCREQFGSPKRSRRLFWNTFDLFRRCVS